MASAQGGDIIKGEFPGKAVVHMLPITDLNPSNMTCIYSTLCFILNQANSLNIKTPVVTFDQPLWIKAVEIVQAHAFRLGNCKVSASKLFNGICIGGNAYVHNYRSTHPTMSSICRSIFRVNKLAANFTRMQSESA